jgi:hypothetical protein
MKRIITGTFLIILQNISIAQDLQIVASCGGFSFAPNGSSQTFTVGEPVVFYQGNNNVTQGFQQPIINHCSKETASLFSSKDTTICSSSNFTLEIPDSYPIFNWAGIVPSNT